MSNVIHPQIEDPRIIDIRNSVHQKNAAIPFLLLPVRLETRFMQVQRTPDQHVTTEGLLEGLSFLQIEIINAQTNINGNTIRTLIAETGNISTAIQSLGTIPVKEKGWIKQLYSDIINDALVVIDASSGGFATESQQFNTAIAQLQAVIDGVKVARDTFLQPAKSLVEAFTTVRTQLKSLNGGFKKLPYNNQKNKKDLYTYVAQVLKSTKGLYEQVDQNIKAITYIAKNQSAQIRALHTNTKALLNSTPDALLPIHADNAWKKFIDSNIRSSINEINTLIANAETVTFEKLNTIPAPPTMQTGDLFFHGIQTYIKITKFNLEQAKGYDAIKKYKKYLEPRIKTLSAAITKPVDESKPGQVTKLQTLYTSINTALTLSINKLQDLPIKNGSQDFGKTKIVTYFNKDAVSIIEGWAGTMGTVDFPKPVFNPAAPETVNQLWVRIYPDDIFITTHEEALSPNELDAGKQFWKTWWTATGDRELELGAWRILCKALGSKRASWVARSLDPRALQSTKNQKALLNKPSLNINDAINVTDNSNQLFKAVPFGGKAENVFNYIITGNTLQTVYSNVQKIKDELSTLKFEQQYLTEKLKVLLIKFASHLNQLIDASRQVDTSDPSSQVFAPAFTLLNKIVDEFNLVQSMFNKMSSLNQRDFVNKQDDPFDFPEVKTKDKDWSVAPYTDCLPDRFVVITTKGDQFTNIRVGNPVDKKLQVGLDPLKFDDTSIYSIDAEGNLGVDEGIKWMTDYNAALSKGMGITLDITQQQYDGGFDRVMVLGVKEADAVDSKQLFEKLLTNHIYSADGMSFLNIGTPTNNTHLKKSGFQDKDDTEERFDMEINNIKYDSTATDKFSMTDGKFFCDALGLDNNVLQYANNSKNLEIANAFAANRAMWGGNMGHYMEEMWDSLFTYDNIRRTENFFTANCHARGIVPSIRIGAQPYGIVTTTAFSKFELYNNIPDITSADMNNVFPWGTGTAALNDTLQKRFETRLFGLLKILQDVWTGLRNENVVHAGNLHIEGGDSQQRFIQMLGLHATSLDYYYRYGINIARGANATEGGFSTNFKSTDAYAPAQFMEPFKALMKEGIFYPSFLFEDEQLANTPGQFKWKVDDLAYSRIRDQFEEARLYVARLVADSLHVKGNIVDTIPVSDETLLSNIENKTFTYLDWLLSQDANHLLGSNAFNDPNKIPSDTLLFMMLRQSLLQGYQEAALNILQREGIIDETLRRVTGNKDHYHYRLYQSLPAPASYKNKYLTKWHFLFKNLSDLVVDNGLPSTTTTNAFYNYINGQPQSMATYLDRVMNVTPSVYNASHLLHFDKLKKIRDAVQTLKRVSTEGLEILLAEQVDLCSYRLDAWQIAFAAKRLQEQRQSQASGIFMGAYGYVENLRRDTNKQVYNDTENLNTFKLEQNKPVYHDPDNQGFIHAPSISQAITAAVLRNAYMTNNETNDIQNRLAVNISSARVRMALSLIDGMRNGQEVGAILGFQFERGLHDRYQSAELDKFIQPFRKAFPLQQKVQEVAGNDPGYISLVANGSAILELVYDSISWLDYSNNTSKDKTVSELLKENNFGNLPAKIKTTIDNALQPGDDQTVVYNSIIEEIDRMADAFDALGDVAISESVYHMVLGNHVRAAAVLTALADGKNMPDPQVIDTQRTGTVVTHKVLLNFEAVTSATIPPGWNGNNSIRALTEPSFNNWLGITFGTSSNIKYVLTRTVNSVTDKMPFAITAINLQPLDLFLLPGAENELKEIIINKYRHTNNDFTAIISIDIKEKHSSWGDEDKSINELFLLMKHIRNMTSNAKCSGASELMLANDPVDSNNPGNHDADEFEKRIKAAAAALDLFITDVETETFVHDVLAGTTAVGDILLSQVDAAAIFTHLENAVFLGLPHALSLPFVAAATVNQRAQAALQQLLNAYKEAVKRQKTADDLIAEADTITVTKIKISKLDEIAKAVLGKNCITLPKYTPNALTDIQTQLSLSTDKKISRHGGSIAVEEWMQNLSRVRNRVYDTTMYMHMTHVFNLPQASLQPVQLPYTADDYWLGIEYPTNYTPSGDKLSLILVNENVFAASAVQCGMVLDEWLEIIPVKEETTAITFNYNQPNAAAPQSLLLAVTPALSSQWEWDDLVHTIIDTIELARNRAVEPDHIDKSFLNQVLPSVFAEVVPPQFRNEDSNPLGVQVVMDFADVIPTPEN